MIGLVMGLVVLLVVLLGLVLVFFSVFCLVVALGVGLIRPLAFSFFVRLPFALLPLLLEDFFMVILKGWVFH